MKVLVTGANGFIGRYLISALLRVGHQVVPAVRHPHDLSRFLGSAATITVDLNRDTTPDVWLPRLAGIDAVINCAGILQGRPGQDIEAIHHAGPKALFQACEIAGVTRVIQISAISAVEDAGTAYAASKMRADDFLKTTTLDWTILKPSLVYAPGAYGGTALMRGLAAWPFVLPLVGEGQQSFRPLTVTDLCELVVRLLHQPEKKTLVVVGPDEVSLKDILVDLRHWLGFPTARVLPMPKALVRALARVGDVAGGAINSTAFQQMEFGNAGDTLAPDETLCMTATSWHDGLRDYPSQVQDRWHARLYFLRPLLRFGLGITWILSGLIGLQLPMERAAEIFTALGLTAQAAPALATGSCLLDVAIGLAVLLRWRPEMMAGVQVGVVVAYTLVLTLALPALWSDPFGALLKNLIFIIAALTLAVIERDR